MQPIDRRTFLTTLCATTGTAMLPGCGGGGESEIGTNASDVTDAADADDSSVGDSVASSADQSATRVASAAPSPIAGRSAPEEPAPDTSVAEESSFAATAAPVGEFMATLVASDQYSPALTADQSVALSLNGSGTLRSNYGIGDQYEVNMSGSLADPGKTETGIFSVRKDPTGASGITVSWWDWIDRGKSPRLETHYLGYTSKKGPLNMITERRLAALMAFIKTRYPQVNMAKSRVTGGSMGAWGSMRLGIHYPQLFAAIFSSRPRFRYAGTSPGWVSIPDFESQSGILYPINALPPLSAQDGGGDKNATRAHMDLIAWVGKSSNKVPFIGWCNGRNEPYLPWQDNLDMVAALRAAKRPFAFSWNNGAHEVDTLKQVTSTYGMLFKLGQGMPYLSASSRDGNLTVDPTGGINLGFAWRNVVETTNGWSCELSNALGETVVTVEPRSIVFTKATAAKRVTIPAKTWVKVSFASDVVTPPPEEPEKPEPQPEPEQQQPAGQVLPTRYVMNPARQILFTAYQRDEQAYDREDSLLYLTGASASIGFRGVDATRSGADRTLIESHYKLLIDGIERASVDVAPGTKRAAFTLPLGGLSNGWHIMMVAGDETETCGPWAFYLKNGTVLPAQVTMPAIQGSHTLLENGGAAIFMARVPARFLATKVPLAARDTPAFSDTATDRRTLVQTDLVPWRPNDLYRTRVTKGVLHTMNQEDYYFSTMVANRYPTIAVLDGPRGVGTVGMTTHLQVGRNSTYFSDPWRVGKITADGTVVTLAGYRHRAPAPRVAAPLSDAAVLASVELVGDWSAVPLERHGFHEIWGFAWDENSLVLNTSVPPIPNNGVIEQPHTRGPRLFVADSQMNRIVLLTFDNSGQNRPAVATEFISGLADPWDVVWDAGLLYVSEREANRIAVYNAATGAFVRVLISGTNGLATVNAATRFVARVATVGSIRTQPCILPEGLYKMDGWLYFGSIAMGQVRRVKLSGGAVQTIVADTPFSHGGSNFMKIAVSDGTFGPRGTVFFVNWLIANQGRPQAFTPDGKSWPWAGVGAGHSGPGRPWETMGYGSAVAVGRGRLIAGYSNEGVTMHSKALPADRTLADPANSRSTSNDYWKKLRTAYQDAGLTITHGPGGFGYYGLPLPWGVSTEIDAFLLAYGHRR